MFLLFPVEENLAAHPLFCTFWVFISLVYLSQCCSALLREQRCRETDQETNYMLYCGLQEANRCWKTIIQVVPFYSLSTTVTHAPLKQFVTKM